MQKKSVRNLVVVLGDQLNRDSSAFDDFDKREDAVWMAEVAEESTHVWSHKQRIAIFLAGMRHFRNELEKDGVSVFYRELPVRGEGDGLGSCLEEFCRSLRPKKIIWVLPGDLRVSAILEKACSRQKIPFEVRSDRTFFSTPEDFASFARGKKQVRMEFFYREMRKKHEILMKNGQPEGGAWNLDHDNRESFGKKAPGIPEALRFRPDEETKNVLSLVEERFASHPGSLSDFAWPVNRAQALKALKHFLAHHLPDFGKYQDAMWSGEPFLFHSLLAPCMNLKLLSASEVVQAAENEYRKGRAPLNSVEGFIRQILGWREYVRGIYYLRMPELLNGNALAAEQPLPPFFWTAETDYNCLREVVSQSLRYGYAHHIQRLMVTGLFSLLLGVDPKKVHEWYLAIYVDAVEWVEAPNTLGMSQFADGGYLASKPYIASGNYISRMSNYCANCSLDPKAATGEKACPFTTLYWDFIDRHRKLIQSNPRISQQWRNYERMDAEKKKEIRKKAKELREKNSGSVV